VEDIELEAATRRKQTGARPLGSAAVLAQDPHWQPKKTNKSPAPAFHAASKAMRRELWNAYALFVAAYRDAAEKLKAGIRDVVFPQGSFPPRCRS
jgi:putative transposase